MAMLAFVKNRHILHGMERRTVYRRTTRFVLFGASVLAGLAWGRMGGEISGWWPVIFGIWTLASFRRARILSVYAMVLFGLSLGWWRGGSYMREVRFLDEIARQNVTITGRALTDGIYGRNGALEFDLGSLQLEEPAQRQVIGKVGVSGYGERMVYRGDEVRISGKFSPGRGSYTAWLSYAELEVTGRSRSVVFSATRHFAAGLQSALPEPAASFGLGILIGQRDTLPEATSDILKMVGLTHIIAVSGYNLTILVRFTRRLLAKRSKFQATFGALALIFAFLLVTGGQPSIVRAAIISTLSLGAWYFGRNIKPMVIIMLTAAGTALWNPLYVWSDIGWYLSFLAFFGVLIVAPALRVRLFRKREAGAMSQLVLESFAAQIMTLPILLFIFNDSNYLVLLANLLVGPMLPYAMVFTFAAGLAGTFIPSLAGWVAWPAKYILTYILDAAGLVARVPHMRFSVRINVATMLSMYVLISLLAVIWWHKARQNSKITDINDTNIVR